jgi:hypothetical protein
MAVEKADPLRPPIEWSGTRGIVRNDQGSVFAWEPSCVWEFVDEGGAGGGLEPVAGTIVGTVTGRMYQDAIKPSPTKG